MSSYVLSGFNTPKGVDSKDKVKELQKHLNTQGAGLVVDGVWGPKTDAAYKSAQTPKSDPYYNSQAWRVSRTYYGAGSMEKPKIAASSNETGYFTSNKSQDMDSIAKPNGKMATPITKKKEEEIADPDNTSDMPIVSKWLQKIMSPKFKAAMEQAQEQSLSNSNVSTKGVPSNQAYIHPMPESVKTQEEAPAKILSERHNDSLNVYKQDKEADIFGNYGNISGNISHALNKSGQTGTANKKTAISFAERFAEGLKDPNYSKELLFHKETMDNAAAIINDVPAQNRIHALGAGGERDLDVEAAQRAYAHAKREATIILNTPPRPKETIEFKELYAQKEAIQKEMSEVSTLMAQIPISQNPETIALYNSLVPQYHDLYEQNKVINEQIYIQKQWARIDGERNHPFFTGFDENTKAYENSTIAGNLADVYREIWYDTSIVGLIALELMKPVASALLYLVSNPFDLQKGEKPAMYDEMNETLKNNYNSEEDKYIDDQKDLTGIPYSYRGTTADNGCGWIAVYNALKILGQNRDAYEILSDVENFAVLGGKWGTDPFQMADYLRDEGYNVQTYYTKADIERAAPDSSACIWVNVYYDRKSGVGAHYTAVQPLESGGYKFYNSGTAKDGPIENLYNPNDSLRFMICINK